MSNQPRTSIILPTYNGSRYLRLALESCLAQTDADFELVIVDDCSSDDTPQIAAEYAARDPRVRVIRNETNQRLPRGLNIGHAAARGEFLTWTSDDNLLRPSFLEELTQFLKSHPEIDLVYSDYTEIDEQGLAIKFNSVKEPEHLALGSVVGASFMYRRSLWEKVGPYDHETIMAEDFDYWMRCYQQGTLAVLHRDLYLYRYHPGSLTISQYQKQRAAVEKVLRKNLPKMGKAPRSLRARGWLLAGEIAAKRGAWGSALGAISKGLSLDPVLPFYKFPKWVARKLRPAQVHQSKIPTPPS